MFINNNFFKRAMLPSILMVAMGGFNLCYANDESNENENNHAKFEEIRKAFVNKDIVKLSEYVNYPFEVCLNDRLKVISSKDELQALGLKTLFNNDDAYLEEYINNVKTMNIEEHNCEICGPEFYYNISYYSPKEVLVNFKYSDNKGIFGYSTSECIERLPKVDFCGNKELDAKIRMLAYTYADDAINDEYENFQDYKYSHLTLPLKEEIDLTLKGEKLHLKRSLNSFDSMKVYSDDKNEYMIIASPGQSRSVCPMDPEGDMCSNAQYIHIFKKPKGSNTCEGDDIVLANKDFDNFCPFNPLYNAEIKLYNELYKDYSADNGTFTNQNKDIILTISDDETYESRNILKLTYQGKEYVQNDKGLTLAYKMKADDKEVMIVLEGDIDSKVEEVDFSNSTYLQFDYTKAILFVRDTEGNCQRHPLTVREK